MSGYLDFGFLLIEILRVSRGVVRLSFFLYLDFDFDKGVIGLDKKELAKNLRGRSKVTEPKS